MEGNAIVERILERFEGYDTCSIDRPREGCISFLKDEGFKENL